MRSLRPTATNRTVTTLNQSEQIVRDALRVLSETVVHLNERVELLEARELLNRRP